MKQRKRNHFGRGLGLAALSNHLGAVQTVAAALRQTDDLLSNLCFDVG